MTSNFNGITKPTPLKNINIPPPFPTNALPEVLKSYTDFIAETAQVSPDMPAAAILAALSVCLQGKAKIRFSPYWSEELNPYVLITAPPGERKSAVFGSITEPIHSFTAEYNERHLIDFQTYRNTKKLFETKLSKAIEKGSDNNRIQENVALLNQQIAEKEKAFAKRLADKEREVTANYENRLREKDGIIKSLNSTIDGLKVAVEKAYHIICNICRAVAVLWCGKGKFADYCADFTPKQNALMCAILDYGSKCTREADFPDLAKKIDTEYYISEDIQREMILVEPEPMKQKNNYLSL